MNHICKIILVVLMLMVSMGMSAQVDLLRRFGMSPEDITPEIRAAVAAFIKHRFELVGVVKATDDFEPEPYPLQGANVVMTCVADTTEMGGAAVDADGNVAAYIFCRNKLKDLRVRVRISYVGMETFDKVLTPVPGKDVIGDKLVIQLDTVVLRSNPLTLAEAEVIGELQKMYQRGDTTIFNADAYETPSGSVLLDLVRRLPGLRYEGGQLTYMGESITEMRLNGDSFFKHDISVALNNMPHDKIKSLKVYEVPDDTLDTFSPEHLVMDMQTKEAVNSLEFANASAGITDDLKGFLLALSGHTYVKGGAQVGINFRTSDMPSTDTPTMRNVGTGVRLSYEQQVAGVNVDGALNHGYDRTDTQTETLTQLFMPGYSQTTNTTSWAKNKNHDYGGRIGLQGAIGQSTRWNTHLNLTTSDSKNQSGYDNAITDEQGRAVSNTVQRSTTRSNSQTFNWDGTLRRYLDEARLNEVGITLTARHTDSEADTWNTTRSQFALLGDSIQTTNHLISSPTHTLGMSANLFYERHFGEKNTLQLGYEPSYSRTRSDETYSQFAHDGTTMRIDSLSYDERNHTMSHTLSSALLIDGRVLRLNLKMRVVPTRLVVENTHMGSLEHNAYNATLIRPSANLKFKFDEGMSDITLGYDGNSSMPSASMLSAKVNMSDPMNITEGNPHLHKPFRHQALVELKYKTLMRLAIRYDRTENQTTYKTLLDPTTGARRTRPTNINGNWNTTTYLYLTRQVGEVSVNAVFNYTHNNNVGFVQDMTQAEPVKSTTRWDNYFVTLISGYTNKNWIAGGLLSYNIDRSHNQYTAATTCGKTFNATAHLSYQADIGLAFGTQFTLQRHFGYELSSANRTDCIWNASVEYKFLRQKRLTARLEWNDILDNNRGFSATMTDTQWTEQRTLGNTSFLQFTLAYRLSLFN